MRKITLVLSMAITMIVVATAADGTATGTLSVKGAVSKMTHAYAISMPSPMNKAKPAIRLVLSDVAIEPKALADEFGLMDLGRSGKLHAVEALVDPTDKSVLGTMMYDAGFKMSSVSVASTNIKLEVKTLDKTTFAGRLYTAKPDDFNSVPFEYAITFNAPIAAK
jgi:hypothetical protein